MARSSSSMSRQVRTLQISSWAAPSRTSHSLRTASGLQPLQRALPVLSSLTYGRRVRLQRQKYWKSAARSTVLDGTTPVSSWRRQDQGASPFHNTRRARSRGRTSLALLSRQLLWHGAPRPRAWLQLVLKGWSQYLRKGVIYGVRTDQVVRAKSHNIICSM
jgi:hypothetical protein